MKPEFEEKSFEAAANGELRLTSPHIYAPGQVAEGILGFDIASFQPSTAPIWNYLQVAAPGGLRLLPNLWPTSSQSNVDVKLPSYVISLIVQYKRAEHMWHHASGQYDYWGQAYYRIKLDPDQQNSLEQLEAAVNGHAIVRYGSPAFHLFDDLEQHTLNTQVLANASFVPPTSLSGHQAWTYVQPGTTGYANPKPTRVRCENWDHLQGQLREQRRLTTVLKHLRELASGIVATDYVKQAEVPTRINVPGLSRDTELAQGLADLLTVGRAIGRTGSEWWLFVEPEGRRTR